MGVFSPVFVPWSFVLGLTVVQAAAALVFGVLLSWIFNNPQICPYHLVFTSLYGCEVLALITHWLGHRRIQLWPFSLWYEAHTIQHHVTDYPSNRFLSDKYKVGTSPFAAAVVVIIILIPFPSGQRIEQ
jgi:hypothetical protein